MQPARPNKIKQYKNFLVSIVSPILNLKQFLHAIPRYCSYIKSLLDYKRLAESEQIPLLDLKPRIHERNDSAGVGDESFYQNAWAFRVIYESKVNEHIDVGSNTLFLGMLSAVTKITFIDIRPFYNNLENLEYKKGDILHLPYEDNSVQSLSCLHTIEHIGLGRFGDKLDPDGSKKAIKELQRIVASGGNLFISVPIGRPRISFNCHRVFSPQQIINKFDKSELNELAGLGPDNLFYRNIDINILSSLEYGLGLFWFKKK